MTPPPPPPLRPAGSPPRPPQPHAPALSAERTARAEATFNSAIERPAAEREACIAEACGEDEELQARVRKLLAAHEQAGEFLEADAPHSPEVERELARLKPEEAGEHIGPYKLREQIGEGGFGVVWVAEQEYPVRRRVALKIIKHGMDTKEVIARFEQERQALAMMDHPNIARVLDAGATAHGRPYFVMELVRGVKLTDYCDDQQLSMAERIELFITVCQAVQHAHQKGIIHRDLKPSNILVTINDGVPVPKVIDFGVAKATQGRLAEHTVYTQFQQMVGTPAYMSPEQAEMTSLDIDTRSDIYSLGVLLYELLTGRTPIDAETLRRAGVDEVRRMIREVDPPRPSIRLKTLGGDELTTMAKRRHVEAHKLTALLKGDLDWIVMKCLEKDRKRRYDTANGLALDLKRHLNNEIVSARAPTTRYLLTKLVKRHRGAVVAGSIIVAALIAGIVVSTRQAVRANREAAKSAAIVRFLTEDLLFQAAPDQNDRAAKVTMEQVLERAARRLEDAEIARQPELEATLRTAIGSTYEKLGQSLEAKRFLTRAVALSRKTLGPQHRDSLLAQLKLLYVFNSMNIYTDESEQLARETAEGLKKLSRGTGDVDGKAMKRASLDAQAGLAWQLGYRGKVAQGIEIQREVVAEYEQAFGDDDLDTLGEYHNLARLHSLIGAYDEAVAVAREVRRRFERSGRREHINSLIGTGNLGLYLIMQGALDEAESLLSEALARAETVAGKSHPTTLSIQHRLARVLDERGNWREAEELARQTLETRRNVLSPQDGNIAYSALLLGRVKVKLGKLTDAEPLLREARDIFREHYASKPELAAQADNWLGIIQLRNGNQHEAEALLLPGIDLFFEPTAEMSPNERGEAIGHAMECYKAMNDPAKAAELQARWDRFRGNGNRQPVTANPPPAK